MRNENNNLLNLKKIPWGWILLGITVWFLFPWIYSVLFDLIISNPESYGGRFGAVGDIYGSLNAFISSAALCAVAYSTWLQVTSLKETRESNEKQLDLAKTMHDEQIKESEYASFLNAFYALLNYKQEKLNSIELELRDEDKTVKGVAILQKLSSAFHNDIMLHHSVIYATFSHNELYHDFYKECRKIFKGSISPIISYFYAYQDLIELIKKSNLSDENKKIYKTILSNSMYQDEQTVLFWISPIFKFETFLQGSELINQIGIEKNYKNYALKHYDETYFGNEVWKNFYSSTDQDPA